MEKLFPIPLVMSLRVFICSSIPSLVGFYLTLRRGTVAATAAAAAAVAVAMEPISD